MTRSCTRAHEDFAEFADVFPRGFEFISQQIHADSKFMVFAFADDYSSGILSSELHWSWTVARGSALKGDQNDTSDTVFDTFPWPQTPTKGQIAEVAAAAAKNGASISAWHAPKYFTMRPCMRPVIVAATFLFGFHFKTQAGEELVTFYPAYGYLKDQKWIIPNLALWVHEPREWMTASVGAIAKTLTDPKEFTNFKSRIEDFAADGERREEVTFAFDGDTAEYGLRDKTRKPVRTAENGFVTGSIEIPEKAADDLLRNQNAGTHRWLSYQATSKGHKGKGRIQLIPPNGISVISDIDDTIKITGIPEGKGETIRNTFFRPFAETPGMGERYRNLREEGACFHYVSGGFYQLYGPLAELFGEMKFPIGTIHMRFDPVDILNSDAIGKMVSREDLEKISPDEKRSGTLEYKVKCITEIMKHFPDREFILIGDSGEKDPEVYAEIMKRPDVKIKKVYIREATRLHKRTKGMVLIDADTGEEITTVPP